MDRNILCYGCKNGKLKLLRINKEDNVELKMDLLNTFDNQDRILNTVLSPNEQ
jgi:hypothetical protein